jgi:hypothetical protein
MMHHIVVNYMDNWNLRYFKGLWSLLLEIRVMLLTFATGHAWTSQPSRDRQLDPEVNFSRVLDLIQASCRLRLFLLLLLLIFIYLFIYFYYYSFVIYLVFCAFDCVRSAINPYSTKNIKYFISEVKSVIN